MRRAFALSVLAPGGCGGGSSCRRRTRPFRGSELGDQKTLWAIAPGTTGPLTVRGRRLDAPGEVRVEEGTVPPGQLELGPAGDDWVYAGA